MIYVIPVFIIFVFAYAAFRRVNLYDGFTRGAKEGLKLTIGVFPYLVSIFVMLEFFKESGLSARIISATAPLMRPLGIPEELCELMILRPLSGSGSLAILQNIIDAYGADAYVTRTACVIMGSSETVFYVTALYFSGVKQKKLGIIIPASLLASFLGALLAALFCRIM